jgi:geranylgeranyl diphosphate synthase type II
MDSFDLDSYRRQWQPRIDAELGKNLQEWEALQGCPRPLAEAMRYVVLGGGKRLRPLMVLLAIRAVGGEEERGVRASCALEIIHAYSLVHDDLPAMDDDDVRRGKPSCHRAYGEAMAVLVGDGLLTQAFGVLADAVPAPDVARAVSLVARCAGTAGMVGGQVDDVLETASTTAEVESVHRRKTAALFECALALGGMLGGAGPAELAALSKYGAELGLAYQIADDLLAFKGNQDVLGRPTGSDEAKGRRTYPAMAGEDQARQRCRDLIHAALESLEPLGAGADGLRALADFVWKRT